MGAGWNALALVDAGEIRQHRNEWAGGSMTANRYSLAGAGLGLGWSKPGDIAVQVTLAAPIGNNPGQTAAGRNQDGSARSTRGWLRIAKVF